MLDQLLRWAEESTAEPVAGSCSHSEVFGSCSCCCSSSVEVVIAAPRKMDLEKLVLLLLLWLLFPPFLLLYIEKYGFDSCRILLEE